MEWQMFTKTYLIAGATFIAMAGLPIEMEASSAASLKNCSRCRLLSGWGMGVVQETAFDPEKIKTIQGEVISVQDLPSEGEVVGGVYVLLKTDTGNVPVRLGPSAYIVKSGFSIEPYDTLTVTGSEVGDEPTGMIAIQVEKGSDNLKLRNKGGAVAWR